MNLHTLFKARAEADRPVRCVLIGAGKFGAMFLAQARLTPGLHVLGVADLSVERARKSLAETGWSKEQIEAESPAKALASGSTTVTDDAERLIGAGGVDVVIEATGDPLVGVRHARSAIARGRHIVMVNVETDALCGALLAAEAAAAGVVYSLAYGDQPAMICEQVDWARACGFEVVAAGKGTLYMPEFHASTPDTVWDHYGLDAEHAAASGMNAKMFNSFLDGTKSAIEMAATANATGLTPAPDGLTFPACATEDLASVLIPEDAGGALHHKGQVEVVSSRDRDGSDLENDLRWGVYTVIEAPSEYVERCFADYGLITDESGRYAAMWRPSHLIGLELGVSVGYAGLLGQATGAATGYRADVAAVAKRNLKGGEKLDGEGGFTVWGRLTTSERALTESLVPIGLANGLILKSPLKAGHAVTWDDVKVPTEISESQAYRARRTMENKMDPRKKPKDGKPVPKADNNAGNDPVAQVRSRWAG